MPKVGEAHRTFVLRALPDGLATNLSMCHTTPFGLSLSKPFPEPVEGVAAMTLRHGVFDKLSPLLRANGAEIHR